MCRKLIYLISFILVPSFVLPSVTSGVAPDPDVGWWKFDEGSGSTALDSSGNGHDGTISGAEWTSPGWNSVGYCLDFDGQGSDRVSVGTFDVTGSGITIACWFKADNLDTPGNDPRMISKAIGGNNEEHWFMISSGRQGDVKVLRFRLKTDGATGELKANTTTGNIELDVWTHMAATWDGSMMRLYKNGVEVGSLAKGGTLSTDATVNVSIGNQPAGTGDRPFDGLIDEVRIYSYALSEAQIKDLMKGLHPKAWDPDPPDGAANVTSQLLQWTAGDYAAFHDIYVGTNPVLGPDEFVKREQYTVYWYEPSLIPGTTYYWRVDEVEADGTTIHTGDVWSFTATVITAWKPYPADGASYVPTDTVLSWEAGASAILHDVYFGADETEVAEGTGDTFKNTVTPRTKARSGAFQRYPTFPSPIRILSAGGSWMKVPAPRPSIRPAMTITVSSPVIPSGWPGTTAEHSSSTMNPRTAFPPARSMSRAAASLSPVGSRPTTLTL